MGHLRTVARGLALRCPHCGKGRIFRSFFTEHRACTECGRVWQKDPGDWTGGAEMLMLVGVLAGVLLLFALRLFVDWSARAEVAVVMGTMGVALPLAYRHVKGFWLGVVRAWEGPDPQPNPIREPEWFVRFWDREGR